MVDISKINSKSTKVFCDGQIEKISEARTVNLKTGGTARVADAVLKDSTGSMNLVLWDNDIEKVRTGSRVKIENGYTTSFKGVTKLNIGKYGKLIVE